MPTCFVIQGFGKKTDFESGRVLDLDASYDVIKEAVETAGYQCVRADEIKTTSHIEKVMYEQLHTADLVIADLSTSNVNAFYELGVRFALRPHRTIVIAEDKINFPFDVNHVPIRTYTHLGDDIGRQEAKRFIAELTGLIEAIDAAAPEPDSPVFTFLPGLHPQSLERPAPAADPGLEATGPSESLNDLKRQAKAAMQESDFVRAIELWGRVDRLGPKDDHVVQQLALATYKSEQPSKVEALHQAADLLERLWPQESLDPETLGLWAAVNKRLFELEEDAEALDRAIVASEKGWVLQKSYYNGINLAFLLDTRAARSESPQVEEDHARARSVRRQVVVAAQQALEAAPPDSDDRYWILATLEEAHFGLGLEEAAKAWHEEAAAAASATWMTESTAQQIDKLRGLHAEIQARAG